MNANEELADKAVGHAVDLAAYSNEVVRRMIALLNRSDARLFAELTQALERMTPATFSVQRLEDLLISVRQLNAQAYAQIGEEMSSEVRRLVEYEAGYQLALFNAAIPPQVIASVGVAEVNVAQVYAAALSRPFQGRLLREWAGSVEAGRMTRIRDTVRQGFIEQMTTDQIVRKIRGTKAKGYSDGIIEIDRRQAEAVVRTAISHTAGFTRDRFYEGNTDLIKAVQWVSTLDTRTSEPCRIRDNLRYQPVDHRPIGHAVPWLGGPGRLHWNCRSSSVPITKSWRELGLNIDDFSPTTRASMDGQVAADMSYADWIKKQPASRQDQILGADRGKLLRDGGLTLDKFYNDKGVYLTLDELRKRDAAAFKRAGV